MLDAGLCPAIGLGVNKGNACSPIALLKGHCHRRLIPDSSLNAIARLIAGQRQALSLTRRKPFAISDLWRNRVHEAFDPPRSSAKRS